jgi:hypothetical protein
MTEVVFRQKAPGIMRQLMADFGLDPLRAAAICGNLGHESGGLTNFQEDKPIVPGSAGGFGWAQWTGPRRRAYEAYCRRNGLDPKSDKANYAYLWLELKGLEGSEQGAIPRLKATTGTLRDFVINFERNFLRAHPKYKHYDARVKWADRALAAYNAAPVGPEIIPLPETPTPVPAGFWSRLWAAIGRLFTRRSIRTMDPKAVVDVKSAWYSKINWTQALAFAAMVMSYFGIDLDEDTRAAALAAIVGITTVVTWLLRTFATTSVTPSAADNSSSVTRLTGSVPPPRI